eukprot:Sspe_Gene.99425::Locus_72959_Transcript_1_1_Confidence_1.000_Length_1288::g.99425::m.99425
MDNGAGLTRKERFQQMKLAEWMPEFSPPWVISGMVLIAVVFVHLGAIVLIASEKAQEIEVRYDRNPACTYESRRKLGEALGGPPVDNCTHTVTFTLDETLSPPVFLYYKLTDFHQNFRRFVKSRSDPQLQGKTARCECDEAAPCPPMEGPGQYHGEEGRVIVMRTGGRQTSLGGIDYSPCGQVAYSMFNDSFVLSYVVGARKQLICDTKLFDPAGEPISSGVTNPCSKKGIAWEGDRKQRFQPSETGDRVLTRAGMADVTQIVVDGKVSAEDPPLDVFLKEGHYWRELGHRIPLQHDLDFMVWARAASLPTFKKLHRRIDVELGPGTYSLEVAERYDVSSFGGEKSVVLATRTWIGGDNTVLGAAYITIGGMAALFAIGMTIAHLLNPLGAYTEETIKSLDDD